VLYADETILWRFALPRAGWWHTAQRARLPIRPLSQSQSKREEALKRQAWLQYRSWSRVTSGVVLSVLGAVQYGTSKVFSKVVPHFADPWWHEVIVLAAGAQGADAGRLVNELLDKEEPAATFLAAQCLETAVQMPLDVRDKIEQQLRKFMPPKTENDVEKLRALGIVVAPTLTKALSEKLSPWEAAYTLAVLQNIDYEPAISAISRFATDHDRSDAMWWMLQSFAMTILALKSFSSKLAKATFLALASKIRSEVASGVVTHLKDGIEILGATIQGGKILQELLDALPADAKKD
jgi:hypothetical protein